MILAQRRKHKGRDFGVPISTTVSPPIFYEIEALAKQFGVKKAEIVRLLVIRGLTAYHNEGQLPGDNSSVEESVSEFHM